jgi:uncharacterized membrane protein YphA (DoxX/SURF4 family)
LLLGRALLSAIFILSGLGKLPHFHDIAGMMGQGFRLHRWRWSSRFSSDRWFLWC